MQRAYGSESMSHLDPDVINAPLPVFHRPPSTERDMTIMRPPAHEESCLQVQRAADYLVPLSAPELPSSPSTSSVDKLLANSADWETSFVLPESRSTQPLLEQESSSSSEVVAMAAEKLPPAVGSLVSLEKTSPPAPTHTNNNNNNNNRGSLKGSLPLDASALTKQPLPYVNVNVTPSHVTLPQMENDMEVQNRPFTVQENWPGIVNDRVLRTSTLYEQLKRGWIPYPKSVILGDSIYPLKGVTRQEYPRDELGGQRRQMAPLRDFKDGAVCTWGRSLKEELTELPGDDRGRWKSRGNRFLNFSLHIPTWDWLSIAVCNDSPLKLINFNGVLRTTDRDSMDSNLLLRSLSSYGLQNYDSGLCGHQSVSVELLSEILKPILWDGWREGEKWGVASQPTKVTFRANKNRWITETVDGASYQTGLAEKPFVWKYQFSREMPAVFY
uniref:Uncharacterized protein n=1 Tax=Timema cristinae TaxID=61476 RepID=A0A7R9CIH7_TIMCR|nr:unnamed protein product [Timema cristinae]